MRVARSNLAQVCFDVTWIHWSRGAPLVARKQDVWGQGSFSPSQTLGLRCEAESGGGGAQRAWRMRRSVAALVRGLTACWSCLRIRGRRGCGNTPSSAVPLRRLLETGEPLGRPSARPDPACAARALSGTHAFIRNAGWMSLFPTDGCQSGQRVAMHGVLGPLGRW